MSKPKNACASKADSQRGPESYQLVEEEGQTDEGPHLQHTKVQESPRQSEVCTLEPPPESNNPMCGKKAGFVAPTDNRQMECRVVEEERCGGLPLEDDCPPVERKCGETNEQ